MKYLLFQRPQISGDDSWWIADWEGDPGRTTKKENAKRYNTAVGAARAITYLKKRYSHIRKIDLIVEEVE